MHQEMPVKVKKNCLFITLQRLTTFKTIVLVTMQVKHARVHIMFAVTVHTLGTYLHAIWAYIADLSSPSKDNDKYKCLLNVLYTS